MNHWNTWLAADGLPNFFDSFSIDWSEPQALRDDFMNFLSHISIPVDTRQAIWEALTVPNYDDQVVKAKCRKKPHLDLSRLTTLRQPYC